MCVRVRVLHEETREYKLDSELLMKLSTSELGKLYAPVKRYFRETYGATVSMTALNAGEDRKFDFIYHDGTPSSFDLRRLLRVFGAFAKYYLDGGFTDVKAYKDEMARFIPLIDHPERMQQLLQIINGLSSQITMLDTAPPPVGTAEATERTDTQSE